MGMMTRFEAHLSVVVAILEEEVRNRGRGGTGHEGQAGAHLESSLTWLGLARLAFAIHHVHVHTSHPKGRVIL